MTRRPWVVEVSGASGTLYAQAVLNGLLDAGLPASPGFYGAPSSVAQLVDFVAAKVLDVLGVEHDLLSRWTGTLGAARAAPSAP